MGKNFSLFEKKEIVKNSLIKNKKINDEKLKLIRDKINKINKMNKEYKEKKPFSSVNKATHKVERRKSGLLEDKLETIYINKYIKTHQIYSSKYLFSIVLFFIELHHQTMISFVFY